MRLMKLKTTTKRCYNNVVGLRCLKKICPHAQSNHDKLTVKYKVNEIYLNPQNCGTKRFPYAWTLVR